MERLSADTTALDRAAALLAAGHLVAIPTETVYGLAGDARDGRVVAAIYAAKGRPSFNPLIVHIPDLAAAERIAVFRDDARDLARAFWPGPLTLVLPLRADAGISSLVTAGLQSVALRVPAHPVARDLLRRFGGPLAAPSANPSGKISPTTADHVVAGLSGRIAAVIDGGPCAVGVESTILSLIGPPRLLRAGGVTVEDLARFIGPLSEQADDPLHPTSPGQLASHYAPDAKLRLDATDPQPNEVWVGFGRESTGAALSLSLDGDLVQAAANLFDIMRRADALAGAGGQIAFAPVPHHGLGLAINDRLRRAAAPR